MYPLFDLKYNKIYNKIVMKKALLIILAFFIFVFAGCSTTKVISESNISPIYITDLKKFYLLPPAFIEKPVEKQQLLTATFGENSISLLSYLIADEKGIFLSLFNDFGTGMGNLSYDGMNVIFESAVFPKSLKAEYILADLQFAYYSVAEINKTLKTIGMYMEVEHQNGKETRTIYSNSILPMLNSKTIEVIEKSSNEVVIHNILRGYEYSLQEALE